MEAKAYLRNARISPRKVQIVLDLIRNKPVDIALATLDLTRRLPARCWKALEVRNCKCRK